MIVKICSPVKYEASSFPYNGRSSAVASTFSRSSVDASSEKKKSPSTSRSLASSGSCAISLVYTSKPNKKEIGGVREGLRLGGVGARLRTCPRHAVDEDSHLHPSTVGRSRARISTFRVLLLV